MAVHDTEKGFALPELTPTYTYYGCWCGLALGLTTNTTFQANNGEVIYSYVTSASTKSLTTSSNHWKLTQNYNKYIQYMSKDGVNWVLFKEGSSATIDLYFNPQDDIVTIANNGITST